MKEFDNSENLFKKLTGSIFFAVLGRPKTAGLMAAFSCRNIEVTRDVENAATSTKIASDPDLDKDLFSAVSRKSAIHHRRLRILGEKR